MSSLSPSIHTTLIDMKINFHYVLLLLLYIRAFLMVHPGRGPVLMSC